LPASSPKNAVSNRAGKSLLASGARFLIAAAHSFSDDFATEPVPFTNGYSLIILFFWPGWATLKFNIRPVLRN
jgi:hypothetical protein